MKSALTMLVIFGFTAIAVFGFLGMSHENGYGHGSCIAATSNGALCPGQNRFDFASFHINSFKNFSTAVFGQSFSPTLLLLVFLLVVAYLDFFAATPKLNLIFVRARTEKPLAHSQNTKLSHWLSLHENSPSSF